MTVNIDVRFEKRGQGRWERHGTRERMVISHFEKLRMILALMWRKKMDAMNERERTRTMNGSLRVRNKIVRQFCSASRLRVDGEQEGTDMDERAKLV